MPYVDLDWWHLQYEETKITSRFIEFSGMLRVFLGLAKLQSICKPHHGYTLLQVVLRYNNFTWKQHKKFACKMEVWNYISTMRRWYGSSIEDNRSCNGPKSTPASTNPQFLIDSQYRIEIPVLGSHSVEPEVMPPINSRWNLKKSIQTKSTPLRYTKRRVVFPGYEKTSQILRLCWPNSGFPAIQNLRS